jgi:hypothetical protein
MIKGIVCVYLLCPLCVDFVYRDSTLASKRAAVEARVITRKPPVRKAVKET